MDAAGRHLPDLLAVLERFPEDDGAGVLWSVVHGVESLPGYEPELVRSVQRGPSLLGVAMVGRLINGGVFEVGGVSLIDLLREVSTSALFTAVRADAADWSQRHAEEPGTADGGP